METNLENSEIEISERLADQLKTNQDGSLFYTKDAAYEYACFYFGSILFFTLVFFVLKTVFPPIASVFFYNFYGRYQEMDDRGKARRIACLTSNTHHVLVFCVVIYNFSESACEGTNSFKWFKSDLCLLQLEKKYVNSCLVSVGYLTYDLIMQ